jgi:DNA-binding XRE family transcriptional regulator
MRYKLKAARKRAGKTQKEMATAISISERMYQEIEAGRREGKGAIWDKLEALFDFKVHQRELREQTSTPRPGRAAHAKQTVKTSGTDETPSKF